ncbi:hypothetical protein CYY_010318 [Polysphondylium violaceum]|uniref:Redoxin domain-containing protein n=1 Tax=Polysphondylium violaceum TaxID=133409 RepID=A0A8J4PKA0_9MYCE|nr:hypothetical protein CYY_010318 [Polysphondylium violaceum]
MMMQVIRNQSSGSMLLNKLMQSNSVRSYSVGFNALESKYLFRDQFNKVHDSKAIFENKKVVIIGIESESPIDDFQCIPSYVKNAQKFYEKGVDYVICLSNMTVPVLRAKSVSLDFQRQISFLSDVDSKFALDNKVVEELAVPGLGTDKPAIEYKRFAMIVNNGQVVYESVDKSDTCEHTKADITLKKL